MSEIRKTAGVGPPDFSSVEAGSGAEAPASTGAEDFSTIFKAALNKSSEATAKPAILPITDANNRPIIDGRFEISPSLDSAGHFPIPGASRKAADDKFHERALGLRAYRQELLASNIANADTPGYKAVDIDIAAALKNGLSARDGIPLLYRVETQGSVDGNTVDMDVERAKFAENAVMLEFELMQVSEKERMELLKNIPY